YQQQIVSPLITGVDPSQPEVNPSRQWLSILGSGFVSQSQVTLWINGNEHPIPSDRTDFVSANKINVLVGLTDPGTWTVQIVNPDNKKSNNFDFVVTSSAPTGWGLDTDLVDLINKHAPNYYNDSWNISLSQYKAWIALISLREAGYGRYVAHSQWGGGYEGDRFNHINVGDAFSFSTGIGAFQLDRGGSQGNANEEWDKMPTIDKLNPDIALLSILRHHKDRFGAGSTLEQFSINSPWVAVRPAKESDFSNDWFQITGSSWDVSKKKREDVQFNPPTVVDTFESQVRKIGTIQWSLSPRWNGYFDTWKISARNWDGGLVCEYYYTYKDGWEIWVYNDPQQSVTHYFEREYQEGQYPQNRQNNEAQVDLAGSTSPQSIIVLATDHNPIKTFESDHKTYDFGEPVEISYSVSTDKGIEEIEILRSDDESIDLDEWDPVWGICLREDLKSYSGSIRDTPLYCDKYWYTIRIKDKEGHSFTTYETISIEVKNLPEDGKWLRILNENPEWVNSISINDNYVGYTNLININKYTQNFALSDDQINALSENTDPALVNYYYVSSLESQENLYAASTSYTVKANKNGYLEDVQSISADFSGVKDITVSLLEDPNHKDSIDIVAGKIYIKGNSASPGNRINIEADIFNDGELASGNFIVRGAILGGSEFGSIQINNLNPGERYTIDEWSTVWPAEQDELLLWVWADSGKTVRESEELNNLLVEKFNPSDEIPVSPTPEPTITPQPSPSIPKPDEPDCWVYITTDPIGSSVYLDGNYVDQSPVSLHATAGTHQLRIEKSGYETYSETLEFVKDEYPTNNIQLTPIQDIDTIIVDGSGEGDYVTIQSAVDASTPYDDIIVRYNGGIPYDVFSIDKEGVTIRADSDEFKPVIKTPNGEITIDASGITLKGLEIKDSAGIMAAGSKLSIIDCNIINNSKYNGGGLWLWNDGNDALIEGTKFENNTAEFSGGGLLI
ncbi:MAG: PEGA domain-containing protein, partial [Sphaerochaetaceae bacterium]|nr:PEGA domain-containing protein [Sphaerochaetaceae bacterium]